MAHKKTYMSVHYKSINLDKSHVPFPRFGSIIILVLTQYLVVTASDRGMFSIHKNHHIPLPKIDGFVDDAFFFTNLTLSST